MLKIRRAMGSPLRRLMSFTAIALFAASPALADVISTMSGSFVNPPGFPYPGATPSPGLPLRGFAPNFNFSGFSSYPSSVAPMGQAAIPQLGMNLSTIGMNQGFPGIQVQNPPSFQTIGGTVYFNNPVTHQQIPALVNGEGTLPGISPPAPDPYSDPVWGLSWSPSAAFEEILAQNSKVDQNFSLVNPSPGTNPYAQVSSSATAAN